MDNATTLEEMNKAEFNKSNKFFSSNNDATYNRFFVQAKQTLANDLLRAKGRVTLNEIRSMLGLPTFAEGDTHGWSLIDGVGFVDFGMRPTDRTYADGRIPLTFDATAITNSVVIVFDSENPNWSSEEYHAKYYLAAMQAQANDILRTRGHITVNDIHDILGTTRTQDGALSGWTKDSYVHFDIAESEGGPYSLDITVTPSTHNVFTSAK